MPRAPRGPGSGQPRPHSRSSSATRMGANLQFTLKEPQPPKHTDKTKKAPFVHEVRTSSSPRLHHHTHPSFSHTYQSPPLLLPGPTAANMFTRGSTWQSASHPSTINNTYQDPRTPKASQLPVLVRPQMTTMTMMKVIGCQVKAVQRHPINRTPTRRRHLKMMTPARHY